MIIIIFLLVERKSRKSKDKIIKCNNNSNNNNVEDLSTTRVNTISKNEKKTNGINKIKGILFITFYIYILLLLLVKTIAHKGTDNSNTAYDVPIIQIPLNSTINDNNKRISTNITSNTSIKKKKKTIPVYILRQMLKDNKMTIKSLLI